MKEVSCDLKEITEMVEKGGGNDPSFQRRMYQRVGDFLQGKPSPSDLSDPWSHPMYKKYHDQVAERDEFLMSPMDVEEGLFDCINEKCRSKKTFSFSKSTRSSDESITVFVRCYACGHAWRIAN